jgi:hypothetical protein
LKIELKMFYFCFRAGRTIATEEECWRRILGVLSREHIAKLQNISIQRAFALCAVRRRASRNLPNHHERERNQTAQQTRRPVDLKIKINKSC